MKTMLTLAMAALATVATAGEVKIGMDAFNMYTKKCYLTFFTGPAERIARYAKAQKDRLEAPDPEVIAGMADKVSVLVLLAPHPALNAQCVRAASRPEKIAIMEKNGAEPVLVVPLESREVTFSNAMGGSWPAYEGVGTITTKDVEPLRGRELDLRVIFSAEVVKDKWKKDYAAKVLK